LAIQRLELTKNDLRQRIAKEARGNAILQASLERRKQALHERRLALEQDVYSLLLVECNHDFIESYFCESNLEVAYQLIFVKKRYFLMLYFSDDG
nr:Rho GTPase-activating protein 7 isoform X1 [Tanacetum cinerariifolium]